MPKSVQEWQKKFEPCEKIESEYSCEKFAQAGRPLRPALSISDNMLTNDIPNYSISSCNLVPFLTFNNKEKPFTIHVVWHFQAYLDSIRTTTHHVHRNSIISLTVPTSPAGPAGIPVPTDLSCGGKKAAVPPGRNSCRFLTAQNFNQFCKLPAWGGGGAQARRGIAWTSPAFLQQVLILR